MNLNVFDFFSSLYFFDIMVWVAIAVVSVLYLLLKSHRRKVSITWHSEEFLIRTGLVGLSCASIVSVAFQFQTTNPALATGQFLTTMGLVLWFRDVAAGLKSKLDTFVPAVSGTIRIVRDTEQARVVDEGQVERNRVYRVDSTTIRHINGIGTETFQNVADWVTEHLGRRLQHWEFINITQREEGGHIIRGTAVDEYAVTHLFVVHVLPNGHLDPEQSRVG